MANEIKIRIESIERETEKAYLVAVEIDTAAGRRAAQVWFPKSQIEMGDGFAMVPAWLLGKKNQELSSKRGSWVEFSGIERVVATA